MIILLLYYIMFIVLLCMDRCGVLWLVDRHIYIKYLDVEASAR
jgi:hypothetical protein